MMVQSVHGGRPATGAGVSADVAVESPAERRSPQPRQRSVRRYLVAAIVLAVVSAAVCGAWWWRHPRAFYAAPESPSLGLGEKETAGGPPLHVAMAYPLHG